MKIAVLALLLAAPPAITSVEVALPDDETQFAGPDADLLNANCTACHSPAMVLTQPPMDAAAWGHSVEKMRHVYKAPITDEDAAHLPAALARTSQSARDDR